jgi:hypothetical protein
LSQLTTATRIVDVTARIDVPGLSRADVRRLLRTKHSMVSRCHNPNHDRFPYYGARGIEVCREWRESTLRFIAWATDNGFRPGLEIDRRDTNGHYCPDNCRWVTHRQNSFNRRKRSNARGSRFKGVVVMGNKWQVTIGGKFLGTFALENDAALAYDRAALEQFGEFARLNFPQNT